MLTSAVPSAMVPWVTPRSVSRDSAVSLNSAGKNHSRPRATPVIVAAALTSSDQPTIRIPVLIVCSAAYGLALVQVGVRIAAREAERRLPELCQIAIRSTV
jgi:hypothetical protein